MNRFLFQVIVGTVISAGLYVFTGHDITLNVLVVFMCISVVYGYLDMLIRGKNRND